jgi:hypothetical protein
MDPVDILIFGVQFGVATNEQVQGMRLDDVLRLEHGGIVAEFQSANCHTIELVLVAVLFFELSACLRLRSELVMFILGVIVPFSVFLVVISPLLGLLSSIVGSSSTGLLSLSLFCGCILVLVLNDIFVTLVYSASVSNQRKTVNYDEGLQ